ncbi:5-formyltetrahydrofolate cyclo-ligase [Nodularia spumigena CS-591/04]|uniref:5-formyltetrahydrofolate cyclo-ligase n=1 Tax=Nodularia spumigena TaxID=70799 RepID=UPI00232EC4B9|nr:5-formyltetrahydrofolate cyclo-ligase [Nodularia spumigena]MDB9324554.1 5-formyltetrahydrofolate cyclo-ligase [Nodularia spumigena CS-591/07A]MDB9331134.1 5-formyltetrahydrofolate cyclo-ligase [Nodularia spumigena CS-591/04]MDB9360760.1 5-formyltetrahydrofolate cyclo-ligase [Nodularia spumigena CS-588/02]MDB9364707.1 5-formyltetrahydrofolate cyclo-ligase [Nodularia spumigena CS-588/02A10]
MGKVDLRRSLIQKRQSMSVGEWRARSDRICTQLQASLLFRQAKTILAYFSFRQEPDLSLLFTDYHYNWGFPRCVGKSLDWHIWKPGDSLQVGAFGITEPLPHAPSIKPAEVDLILVPCVACDYDKYRLGYGGGYYDRLLSSPDWANTPTIGVVFDFAYLSQLPIESWDKPLQSVISENYYTYSNRQGR